MPERTGYARTRDGAHIYYAVDGEGVDILRIAGNLIAIDMIDDEPHAARYARRLASMGRLIQYDVRGVGRSDPIDVSAPPETEAMARDALAVLDALEVERVSIVSDGGSFSGTALTLAAIAPDRVQSLALVNASARIIADDDYPFGYSRDFVQQFTRGNTDPDQTFKVGDSDDVALAVPTLAGDPAFREWWQSAGRRSASPAAARALLGRTMELDVRARLGAIKAPTLVMHRVDNVFMPVGHGRYLAEHIPDAVFIELPGADQPPWARDADEVLDHIEEFFTGQRGGGDRVLATLVFTDIVDSTRRVASLGDREWSARLDLHDARVRSELARYGGREVNTTGDGFFGAFDAPTQAVRCAAAILSSAASVELPVRAGVHTGECEKRGDDLAGLTVHIAARIAAAAGSGEVLVSRTVRDLVGGSGLQFADRGEYDLKGVPERWQLFALEV